MKNCSWCYMAALLDTRGRKMVAEIEGAAHDCRPVSEILNQIGGKWTVLIINRLGEGPRRFSELKREIGGISQKVLTSTLRELEMDGFIKRDVTLSIPPRVDYELTQLGQTLRGALVPLQQWAARHRDVIRRNRGEATQQP